MLINRPLWWSWIIRKTYQWWRIGHLAWRNTSHNTWLLISQFSSQTRSICLFAYLSVLSRILTFNTAQFAAINKLFWSYVMVYTRYFWSHQVWSPHISYCSKNTNTTNSPQSVWYTDVGTSSEVQSQQKEEPKKSTMVWKTVALVTFKLLT